MLIDVLAVAELRKPGKIPSKETLNHPGLIKLASGIDPYLDTHSAYIAAYEALGIDVINRVPFENKRGSLQVGESVKLDAEHSASYLGLYETVSRTSYPYPDADEMLDVREFFLDYDKLITPVPGSLDKALIERSMRAASGAGLYYYMYYTTLFMWGIEWLGTEVFLTAAASDPEAFDRYFLNAAYAQTARAVELLAGIEGTPFVFLHDDLADAQGQVFRMDWYEKYIFPRYKKLFFKAKSKGKKVIFVADGKMDAFFDALKDCGVDGVMFESPATDFEKILSAFEGKIVIGGIDTRILTFGTPEQAAAHTDSVIRSAQGNHGFMISSAGGLHGNIPLANLEAYFDARAAHGITPENWRNFRA